ncbi:MAG: hypothetical protein ACI8Q1_002207 [Parvicella sp.]|jgi:hypothetical protein
MHLLQISQDSLEIASSDSTSLGVDWWFCISVIEFLIIVVLVAKFRALSNIEKEEVGGLNEELRKAKSFDIDMENVISSINSSRDLYKKLSRTCHPDLFQNSELKSRAEEIFQEISENKRDYKKLSELRELAIKDLNIKL